MSGPDTNRNNEIARLLRELADLFHGVAQGAGPKTEAESDQEDDAKAKKGKKSKPAPADDESPAENDKTISPDHPKRIELQKIAKEYKEKTDLATAQKAMLLYGEGSKNVPDEDLADAIKHFKKLLAKLAESDDEAV